ncbi:MAG: DUF4367 domain-containing protein [Clostridiales bacterium]|nr:DUF4367 domain-containing protein [Clostridiales bacterium]
MTSCEKSDLLFDALLKAAVREVYHRETSALADDEALNGCTPSPVLDSRIEGIIKRYNRKIRARRLVKGFGKAAACLCILLAVSSVILLSVEATRIAIFNAVLTWHEQYTEIRYETPSDTGGRIYRPAYLPEGYSEKEFRPGGGITLIVYENEAGDQIVFMQEPAGSGTTAVDNEHTDYSRVKVSGSESHMFEARDEGNASMLIWEKHGVVFNLIAVLEGKELIRIGESLRLME